MVLCPSGASDYQPALSQGHCHILLSSLADPGLDFLWEMRGLKSEKPTFALAPMKISEAKTRALGAGCRTGKAAFLMLMRAQPPCHDRKVIWSGDRDSGRGERGW